MKATIALYLGDWFIEILLDDLPPKRQYLIASFHKRFISFFEYRIDTERFQFCDL